MTTPAQESFVYHYLITGSPARAYYASYRSTRPFEGNSAWFRALARQQILTSRMVLLFIIGITRMVREQFLIAANDLIARAYRAYEVAEASGDAKAMVAAIATVGRLAGVEFEAKAIADDRIGTRIAELLRNLDASKSAAELAEAAGPAAITLLTAIVDGSIPADVNLRRAAANDLLNRALGMPNSESVQAQKVAVDLQKRLDRLVRIASPTTVGPQDSSLRVGPPIHSGRELAET